MNASLTLSAAKAALAERAPGITLRKAEGGDFRVTFTLDAIAAAFPGMTRPELIEKAESLAAYESDAESALATGLAMAETGLQPAPATAEAAPAPEADKPGREYIDMTPTWAAMESTFRLLIENGNAEGRRTAWGEIGKALRLADERNEMAKAIYALSIVANETAHCIGKPGKLGEMARDEMDSALAAAFAFLDGS